MPYQKEIQVFLYFTVFQFFNSFVGINILCQNDVF